MDPLLKKVSDKGYKCAARRAPTIVEILSPSLFCSNTRKNTIWLQHRGSYKCGGNRCNCCNFIVQSTQFDVFNINGYMNCNTSHVIYLILCTTCRLQYVGCTFPKPKQHFRRHITDVTSAHRIPVSGNTTLYRQACGQHGVCSYRALKELLLQPEEETIDVRF